MISSRSLCMLAALVCCLIVLAACASPRPRPTGIPWFDASYTPPVGLTTQRMMLEPLGPHHTSRDFAALMSSRDHLQHTLRWGDWPRANFTLSENKADLTRHWKEYVDREAYAFTVLTFDMSECLGCIYFEPLPARQPGSQDAQLHYWVTEAELANDFDQHLVSKVLAWTDRAWPFERVYLPTRVENTRGIALLDGLGLARAPSEKSTHVMHVWERK